MFKGVFTALLTPFKSGELDEVSFRSFIDFQIESGIHGLVPVGTTGESPTVSHDEHKLAVEICIDQANKKVPVIAGTGSNNTAEAIELTNHACEKGADAALVVTPYYNKPNQEGLYAHYKAIAENSDIPIVIYNIPGRSIVDMNLETMNKLFQIKNIIGVKDATSDISRVFKYKCIIGDSFNQLSGEDATTLAYMTYGGHGSISVTSNIAPKLCSDFMNLCLVGKFDEASKINDKLMKLHECLFLEPSPGPVKYAAEKLGLMSSELRLPLVEISKNTKDRVDEAMKFASLI
ncbi:4-hydroxy-tetrahydrodipicolinate synthase [Pelagibacteraceae bacterium]|nr:4-hydroxy-tetrahydrodipicolinate synthase [Pelagibacteraceae bacterium]